MQDANLPNSGGLASPSGPVNQTSPVTAAASVAEQPVEAASSVVDTPSTPPDNLQTRSKSEGGFLSKIKPKTVLAVILAINIVGVLATIVYAYFLKPYSKPKDIRVTNVTSRSVTISWVTDKACPGVVIYSEKDNFGPWVFAKMGKNMDYDDRDLERARLEVSSDVESDLSESKDTNVSLVDDINVTTFGNYFVHHVTLRNLDPETEYYFMVGNSIQFSDGNGLFADDFTTVTENKIKTYAELDTMPVPNPSYGHAETSDGNNILDGVMFIDVSSIENAGPLSSVLNESGNWYIDLSSLRNMETGESYAEVVSSADKGSENLFLEAGSYGKSVVIENSLNNDAPAPNISIDEEGDETSDESVSFWQPFVLGANADDCPGKNGPCGDHCCECCYFGTCWQVAEEYCGMSSQPQEEETTPTQEDPPVTNPNCTKHTCAGSYSCNVGETCGNCSDSKPCTCTTSFGSCGIPAGSSCTSTSCGASGDCTPGQTKYDGSSLYTCCNGNWVLGSDCTGVCTNGETKYIGSTLYTCCNGTLTEGSSCAGICNNGETKYVGSALNTCCNGKWTEGTSCVVSTDNCGKHNSTICTGFLKDPCESGMHNSSDHCCYSYEEWKDSKCTSGGGTQATCGAHGQPSCAGKCNSGLDDQDGSGHCCTHSEYWTGSQCAEKVAVSECNQANEGKECPYYFNSTCNCYNLPIVGVCCSCGLISIINKEDCNDAEQKDEDGDGKANCDDPACSSNPACSGDQSVTENLDELVLGASAQETESVVVSADGVVFEAGETGVYTLDIPGYGTAENVTLYEGGEYMFYIDQNGDGVASDDEIIVMDRAIDIQVNKEKSIFTYDLQEGYNFVSFPYLMDETDSYEVIKQMNEGLDKPYITSISRYYSGNFDVTEYRGDMDELFGPQFTVIPGWGYIVRSHSDVTISMEGKDVAAPVGIDFPTQGWYLVGVHGSSTAYTAESLIDSIDATQPLDADNVTQWEQTKALYEGLQKSADDSGQMQVYGFDFTIDESKAYFVRIVEGGEIWKPQ